MASSALLRRSALPSAARSVKAARATPLSARARQVPRFVTYGSKTEEKKTESKSEVEDEFDDGPDNLPSAAQVQGLLQVLCNETEIAEMNLKMGNFALRVRRSTAGAAAAPAALAPAAYAAPPPAVSKPAPAESTSAEEAAGVDVSIDESVITVTAPKVGVFRRGNYAGGKRVGKGNAADEKTSVKKGQPLGYVEQLGTFVKVEAPQAGEIVRFLVPDGGSVEYKQGIVEMAPFFGGHIIGDSKYA